MPTLPKIIVILGPTASGKTELAIKLAQKLALSKVKGFNGAEIISADSRQIYRDMDIGTNKIIANNSRINREYPRESKPEYGGDNSSENLSGDSSQIQELPETISHHMIDIVNPDQEFTLAQYKEMAVETIKNIRKRGKLPFLVGGTGLYIQAITDNLQIPKVEPNEALRKKLEALDLSNLLEMLKKIDPQAAEVIDTKNKRRLIRALEVSLATGKAFSSLKTKGKPLFDCLQIGIEIPKEKLYEKINKRVDKMIEQGLVDEVKRLKEKYSCGLPSMSGIGYKEICGYLLESSDSNHGITQTNTRTNAEKLNETISLIKRNTRHYARRQLTWFRRDKRIHWLVPSEVEGIKSPACAKASTDAEALADKSAGRQKQAEKLVREFLKNK